MSGRTAVRVGAVIWLGRSELYHTILRHRSKEKPGRLRRQTQGRIQQLLHAVRRALSHLLGDLPAVLARQGRQERSAVAMRRSWYTLMSSASCRNCGGDD